MRSLPVKATVRCADPPDIADHVVAASTLPQLLTTRASHSPADIACYERAADGHWLPSTWSQLALEVGRLATALTRLGLAKGDRLAVLAPPSRQWQVTEYAALSMGAVVVGIDAHASVTHIEHILRHADVCALVVDTGRRLQNLPQALLTHLRFLVTFASDTAGDTCLPLRHWQALLCQCDEPSDQRRTISGDDVATLIYTSGTTGTPKAIAYTHRHLMVACHAILNAFPQVAAGDRLICWLPMAHLFQRMMNMVALARGVVTYFEDEPRRVVETANDIRPTVFIAVPRFYEKLYEGIQRRLAAQAAWRRWLINTAVQSGIAYSRGARLGQVGSRWQRLGHTCLDYLILRQLRRILGSKIKFMITGTAPTPAWLLEFFHGIGLLLLEAYGFSENTVPIAANRFDVFRFGSVGKPFATNEMRFTADGELLIRGPGLFAGYWNDPTSRACFTADGFYRSGDLGYLDENDFLYLTGRKSQLLKTSTGRRIDPVWSEAVYNHSPFVDQLVIIGNARQYLVGLVSLHEVAVRTRLERDGHILDPKKRLDQLPAVYHLIRRELDRLGATLAEHERVVDFAIVPQPFSIEQGELTPTFKLRRHQIEASYAAVIDALYARGSQGKTTAQCGHT